MLTSSVATATDGQLYFFKRINRLGNRFESSKNNLTEINSTLTNNTDLNFFSRHNNTELISKILTSVFAYFSF